MGQKRLALESLLRGPDQVLLLDEPDNYLDVPGKRWLEAELRATQKTVLLVSHDRELLAAGSGKLWPRFPFPTTKNSPRCQSISSKPRPATSPARSPSLANNSTIA